MTTRATRLPLTRLRGWLPCVLMIALALPAAAQDASRVSREREALRRTQQALKQTEEQRAALQAERDRLLTDKAGAEAAATQARVLADKTRAEASGDQASIVRLRSELDARREATEQLVESQRRQTVAAQARIDELVKAVAESKAALDERNRTFASVTTLLERGTGSLAAAEEKNRKLYELSRELIEQVRERTGTDPVLGLGRVELENWAEAARDSVDAQRIVARRRP